jgi:hypothetical protein
MQNQSKSKRESMVRSSTLRHTLTLCGRFLDGDHQGRCQRVAELHDRVHVLRDLEAREVRWWDVEL